ncbi:hypothetical protein GRX03_08725 [Halovenus sp. WSH3]|uniref:Uncharacterized protein n=1 Tax=Halovenus carboxidivorans TaxID=2692199 RepID=A0A6B0T183_9EURY|nr:hypothetical protein [Halovenus carboxidivorans]MXR51685.1 hypothetical protein [Halovenus carboxidivorans]
MSPDDTRRRDILRMLIALPFFMLGTAGSGSTLVMLPGIVITIVVASAEAGRILTGAQF